jgi:DNA repair protein RecO (recombination protein O)
LIINAWLIHKKWTGDTSAQVTLFTRELGLISARCKGGRTPKKQALLQAFTPLWINLTEKHGFYYLNKLEIQAATLFLSGNALLSGWYLNEMLQHALRQEDAATALYDSYENSLCALAKATNTQSIEIILRKFELVLLREMGYALSWTHEAHTLLPIVATKFYELHVGYGFIAAQTGISGAHLLAIEQNCFEDQTVLQTAKIIMRQAIHHALDGVCLQTRNLYVV